ncbi:hypothetical protein C7N43_00945, partial [Sphingobacteriales bacterium UPWRP_1]
LQGIGRYFNLFLHSYWHYSTSKFTQTKSRPRVKFTDVLLKKSCPDEGAAFFYAFRGAIG